MNVGFIRITWCGGAGAGAGGTHWRASGSEAMATSGVMRWVRLDVEVSAVGTSSWVEPRLAARALRAATCCELTDADRVMLLVLAERVP